MLRDAGRKDVQAKAELAAEERLLTALVGEGASAETRGKFRKMLRAGELEDKEVEVAVAEASPVAIGAIDLPGVPPGQMANLGEMMKGMFGGRTQKRRMPVAAARTALTREESDKLLDNDALTRTRSSMPSRTASCSSTRSTRFARARARAASAAATCRARGCSATCCR